jgi:hypothetical protein
MRWRGIGLRWEDIEYKWTEDAERKKKTRGQNAIKNTAVQAFSYVALLEGVSWDDMDEGGKTPKESRNSPPSPEQPTSGPRPPIYGPIKAQRHAWKVYALSKCKRLTMCDTWTTLGLDTRHHTHNLLHNGKAHQLFPMVETVRIIPLASASKQVTPLCSAHGSCPFIQEISPKKVVHRNGTANGFALTDEPVDELVLFLPNGQWPDDMDYDYRVQTLEQRLGGVNCNTIKLVFGPLLLDKNRSEHHMQYRRGHRPGEGLENGHIPLERLIAILRTACSESKMTLIFGLDKVQVPKPDDFFRRTRGPQQMHSHTELFAVIRSEKRVEREEDDMDGNYVPPGPYENYQIHALDEYISSHPNDELLAHEIDGSDCWEWESTKYWLKVGGKGKGKASHSRTTGAGTRRRYGK